MPRNAPKRKEMPKLSDEEMKEAKKFIKKMDIKTTIFEELSNKDL